MYNCVFEHVTKFFVVTRNLKMYSTKHALVNILNMSKKKVLGHLTERRTGLVSCNSAYYFTCLFVYLF
jgi:hypothetical protein